MNALSTIDSGKKSTKNLRIWNDDIFVDYYNNYYNDLNSKELDKDFSHELNVLVKALGKLNDSEKKALINLLAKVIEHYLEQKIDKEIDYSFKKILKF